MLKVKINLEGIISVPYTCTMFHTNQKNTMSSFNYLFFTNFNGSADFIYDFQADTWVNQIYVDMSETHKYEFSGLEIPEYVKEVFELEKCISDKNGIQVGVYGIEVF